MFSQDILQKARRLLIDYFNLNLDDTNSTYELSYELVSGELPATKKVQDFIYFNEIDESIKVEIIDEKKSFRLILPNQDILIKYVIVLWIDFFEENLF